MHRLGHSRYFLHLMSQSRHWSVSQSANKDSGVCSCCQAVHQLHIKDGTVHSHGPRNNPCPGSHKLPLGVASAPSNLVNQSTSSNFCSSNASHSSSPNLDGTRLRVIHAQPTTQPHLFQARPPKGFPIRLLVRELLSTSPSGKFCLRIETSRCVKRGRQKARR